MAGYNEAECDRHAHSGGRVGPTSRRRLLFVINDADFFISHRLPLAVAARNVGYDVHIAAANGPGGARLEQEGFTFHPIPLTRSGSHPWQEVRTVLALYRLFRRLRPDLVHTVTVKAVIYGGIAARFARVRALVSAIPGLGYVFTQSGFLSAVRRMAVRIAYRLALRHPRGRVIFQNPDDLRVFSDAALIRADVSVLIKGAGVDLAAFHPIPEPAGIPLVILASRMLWAKGIEEFVSAAALLRSEGVVARFALVGSSDPGNPTAVPEQQLRGWQESGVVEWWGRRDDMPTAFAQAHVVCLPTTYGEGVPKVLIEAAACGRSIIATDVPGCREIVRHEVNGLLVPAHNIQALAQAMKRLIQDAPLRQRFGAHGRAIAEADFGVDKVVAKTIEVYRELFA